MWVNIIRQFNVFSRVKLYPNLCVCVCVCVCVCSMNAFYVTLYLLYVSEFMVYSYSGTMVNSQEKSFKNFLLAVSKGEFTIGLWPAS